MNREIQPKIIFQKLFPKGKKLQYAIQNMKNKAGKMTQVTKSRMCKPVIVVQGKYQHNKKIIALIN